MLKTRTCLLAGLLVLCVGIGTGCQARQSAADNEKMNALTGTEQTTEQATEQLTEQGTEQPLNENAIVKKTSTYDCDIEADQAAFDGNVDIVVGDNLYATQINDWYIYFDRYEGKVVEIEGYYIGDFQPYDFIGRYGPSCPYCQGGYVSFEILSDEDLTQYQSETDWLKVTGILREGVDSMQGPFYYIEALKVEKMPEVGLDTVTN